MRAPDVNLNNPMEMSLGGPRLNPGAVASGQPTPQPPAANNFAGAITPEEQQLMRKLHGSNYYEKTDRAKLDNLRAAGRELGGYGDFKNLRNLSYANQYGSNSDYGRLAQKYRDTQAQQMAAAHGMPVKAGEYTMLTRRNTGVVTSEGNVWINPADQMWLNKSAAYQHLAWEDYMGLDPSDEPSGIVEFFN
jgi:hypothetical protein